MFRRWKPGNGLMSKGDVSVSRFILNGAFVLIIALVAVQCAAVIL